MSYASLSELWPDFKVANKFQKYKNTLPKNIVNNLIETSNTRGGNKYVKKSKKIKNKHPEPVMYERSREYPLDHKEEKKVPIEKFSNVMYGKYYSECSTILKHLSACAKCREFIRKKFYSDSKPEKKEEESENDEYLDLAIYIVTGIFVLFVLDMLMKFGRKR